MSLLRYPEYKDSGVKWLPPLPSHWSMQRFKQVFVEREERSVLGDELLLSVSSYTGITPKSEHVEDGEHLSRAESLEGYKVCYPDDLVMNIMLAWNRGLGISRHHGIVSPAYSVYRLKSRNHPKYLDYLVRSDEYIIYFKAFSAGVIDSRLRLYPDSFRALYCSLPPIDEQERIARFLDAETLKIDGLIEEQEKLITLLKEKRQAVISHAVTQGLDPSAPMKDSGIEWIGAVPVHWKIAATRRLIARIEQGWSPECYSRPAEEGEWGILKAGCVNRGVLSELENKALPEELEPLPEYEVKEGDLLMSRASGSPELVGSTAFVKSVRPLLMLSDKIFRIHVEDFVVPEYLSWLFNSKAMRTQIERSISGADGLANNLPQSSLLAFLALVPPASEQLRIVDHLNMQVDAIDKLVSEAENGIELLQERRRSLISSAVTGKIHVLV